MAGWITHTMIAENILRMNSDLDKKSFCIGNIAPDCNIENEDWTDFTPSREFTHWMSGTTKLTVDYDGFYNKYIKDKSFFSNEHYSFLLGYYSHLITDMEFTKFVRNEQRVMDMFERIKTNSNMSKMIEDYPENYDTLKKIFKGKNMYNDIAILENHYLTLNPEATYNSILRKTESFPDYLDFLPKGAIVRKIKIMAYEPQCIEDIGGFEFYFFTAKEFETFVIETNNIIHKCIVNKLQLI